MNVDYNGGIEFFGAVEEGLTYEINTSTPQVNIKVRWRIRGLKSKNTS